MFYYRFSFHTRQSLIIPIDSEVQTNAVKRIENKQMKSLKVVITLLCDISLEGGMCLKLNTHRRSDTTCGTRDKGKDQERKWIPLVLLL